MAGNDEVVLDAVSVGYPGRGEVLHEARLTVPPGARLALLGANGSGKSTLLRCLSGALRPSGGRVLVGGRALVHSRAGLTAHRQQVQLVVQDPDDQLFSASVGADVSFGPMNLELPEAEVRARVDEALDLLAVAHLRDRPTHHLSYGERKRVAMAGAYAMHPGLLALDEPTAGLDPAAVREALAALDRLHAAGTSLVMATHDVDLALAWADTAAVVVDGTVVTGDPAVVLGDADLVHAARLGRPWVLDVVEGLRARGLVAPDATARDRAQLLTLLDAARA